MKNLGLYELGRLAQKGDEFAMLEIIERKKNLIKKYSYGNEDLYQFIIMKIIVAIKNFNFF